MAKVALTAGENNQVELIRLCLIYSSYEKFYVSQAFGVKANAEHPWLKATGERLVNAVQPLPANLQSGERAAITGFTGFDVKMDEKNMRLTLNKVSLTAANAETKYGICKCLSNSNSEIGHDSLANSL